MKTTVRNLLNSEEVYIYTNELSPVENMVNAIIYTRKQTGSLLNEDFRSNIITIENLVKNFILNGQSQYK